MNLSLMYDLKTIVLCRMRIDKEEPVYNCVKNGDSTEFPSLQRTK